MNLRIIYHAVYDGFRGETLESSSLSTYHDLWKEKTKTERVFKPFALTMVFNPTDHVFFNTPKEMVAYETHQRIELGETVKINKIVSMTRTQHTKYSKPTPFCPTHPTPYTNNFRLGRPRDRDPQVLGQRLLHLHRRRPKPHLLRRRGQTSEEGRTLTQRHPQNPH